jgi:hypothetical protein
MGSPHPGPGYPAFDIDLIDWRYKGGIWRPCALWEETRLGGDFQRMKEKQIAALRVLSNHLCIPAFLVEVNKDASVFVLHGILEGGWVRQMDRVAMARFVESLS